jgi:hypothetical protein
VADSDILRGAIQAAAGNTLGLTQDQVLDLKRQQLREQQRENRGRRAERAGNQQTAEEYLAEDTKRFQSTGSFVEQERYPDPFGIERSAADPDDLGSDSSREGYDKQRGGYVIVDRGKGKEKLWREKGQLYTDPKFAKDKRPDFPNLRNDQLNMTPRAAGMGGPSGLATQLADMVARGEVDAQSLVPGSSTKTIGALINEMALEADPQLRAEADNAIGRQTAQRDAARFTPAGRAIQDAKAEREAIQYIANSDNGLSDIQRIQSLGLASKKMNKSGVNNANFSVTPALDVAAFEDAIQMIGPDGLTVGYADNQDRFIADVNISGTDNITNAPLSRTATWMQGNLPSYGQEGGTSFGARQVNPGNELRMLNERLGKFGLATGIRGIDDLEQVVRAVTVDAAFSGRGMFNYDPEQGKAVAVRNPGIDEVLYGLDYTADEKARLASALQTTEAAMRSPVNSLAKELYAAGIPSESQSAVTRGFEKDAQLSRITNERVGRDNKKTGERRTSVRKGLSQLDASPEKVFAKRDPSTVYATTPDGQQVLLPDAQQDLIDARLAQGDAQRPFQAAIEGEPLDRARFVGKGVYRMTAEQRAEQFGPKGAEVANETIRRAIEDKQLRTAASKQQDPIAQEFRARDAQFEAAGQARNAADNAREVNEAFERMGMSLEGKGQMLLGGQIVPDSRKAKDDVPDRNVVPQGPLQTGMTVGERKLLELGIGRPAQTATSAAVNPTPDPIPLAARGGWMGGPGRGEVRSPFDPAITKPVMAQKAAPMQEALSGISYNESAPDPWSQPVGTGNGIGQEIAKRSTGRSQQALPYGISTSGPAQGPVPGSARKQFTDKARNFGKSPKYERANRYGRRAAYGGGAVAGLAGLDALIGGERDNREQEVYQ